jgi:mycofactocin glycosyltransferase
VAALAWVVRPLRSLLVTEQLPPDWQVQADAGLRIVDNAKLLIGGAPLRVMRVSGAGANTVKGWFAGEPVGESTKAGALARRLLDAGMVHPEFRHWGQTPLSDLRVTVVIPVKDEAAGLERLLAALPDVPVVVVDDGSATPVVAANAAVIRREQAGGPGRARMAGLASVETDLVAFIDADVEPGPNFLPDLIRHFGDPAVVAVAPRVRSRFGSSVIERYETDFSPLDLGAKPANVGPRRSSSYVPTAAFIIRRAALDNVGGFDPGFRFGEDVDLVWRLVAAGGTVRYDPTVEVTHDPRRTWVAWLRQRMAYGSAAPKLAQRHGAAVAPARCSPWSAFAWLLVALRHPFLGGAVAAASTTTLAGKLSHIPNPNREAGRLAGWGHLHAGRGMAQAVARVWWPIALPLAIVMPRTRLAVAAALLGGPMLDWHQSARRLDPVRAVALRVIDQMAYGVGVWKSSIDSRSFSALRPDFVSGLGSNENHEATTVTRS